MSYSLGWGKVILLGEHAVVYGFPALAAALDRGVTAAALPTPAGGRLRLDVPAWDLAITTSDDHPAATALAAIADVLGMGRPALTIVAEAQVPPGAGLGSSAALAVATTRAMLQHLKRPVDIATLTAAANAAEVVHHGTPSGIDVAIAIAGGFGVYRKSTGLRPMTTPSLRLLVAPGERRPSQPRSTAKMVEHVAEITHGNAEDARLAELGGLTDIGARALLARDLPALGAAMNRAHMVLGQLGVSTPRLDDMCTAALAAGAHGAKLTGAGGGGAIIALAPRDKEDAVLAAWKAAGLAGFAADVGR
jgi:mevalonate kinase